MSKTLELPDGTIVTDIRSSATTEEIETFLTQCLHLECHY